jgi:transposase
MNILYRQQRSENRPRIRRIRVIGLLPADGGGGARPPLPSRQPLAASLRPYASWRPSTLNTSRRRLVGGLAMAADGGLRTAVDGALAAAALVLHATLLV